MSESVSSAERDAGGGFPLAALLGLPTNDRLLVGIEDDPECEGGLLLYVGARYTGIHTHVAAEGAEAVRRGYYSGAHHVFASVPDDALCDCRPTRPLPPGASA